mmetsp:Transcript_5195/g.7846  ORF Transcript_5195/g.7846 Transcript_5195/m.7846 type:complete len:350 (+) Transcript_5195:396-1445(+)
MSSISDPSTSDLAFGKKESIHSMNLLLIRALRHIFTTSNKSERNDFRLPPHSARVAICCKLVEISIVFLTFPTSLLIPTRSSFSFLSLFLRFSSWIFLCWENSSPRSSKVAALRFGKLKLFISSVVDRRSVRDSFESRLCGRNGMLHPCATEFVDEVRSAFDVEDIPRIKGMVLERLLLVVKIDMTLASTRRSFADCDELRMDEDGLIVSFLPFRNHLSALRPIVWLMFWLPLDTPRRAGLYLCGGSLAILLCACMDGRFILAPLELRVGLALGLNLFIGELLKEEELLSMFGDDGLLEKSKVFVCLFFRLHLYFEHGDILFILVFLGDKLLTLCETLFLSHVFGDRLL